jgi:polyhydroxybutyrate depolymerase
MPVPRHRATGAALVALLLGAAALAPVGPARAQDATPTATPALAAGPGTGAADRPACGGTDPCPVADGRYYVRAPAGWDGEGALPVIVWFHGWQDTGLRHIRETGTVADWTRAGWLFVAADGAEKSWAHQGSPSRARDDIAYVRDVLADVAARFPIDAGRVLAAGFSQGGSMVWDLACRLGAPFTHFAPVAGAFWEPAPTDCPAGAAAIRHVHGTADTVVPLAGRPIGDRWHQADVFEGLALWRETNGCPAEPDRTARLDDLLDCRSWETCSSGKPLALCLHEDGHRVSEGWAERTRAWVGRATGG